MMNNHSQPLPRKRWPKKQPKPLFTGPTQQLGADRALRVAQLTLGLIGVGLIGMAARVVQLQTHPPAAIRKQVDSQHSKATLTARRGCLLDRHGRVLAASELAYRLFVDPKLIEQPNTFSEQVGYQLGYDPAWIERKISDKWDRRYVVIDPKLNDQRLAAFEQLNLPGLAREPVLVRAYPHGPLAGQVIGFVGTDGVGLEGLERSIEPALASHNGRLRYLRDARRRTLWIDPTGYRPPHDGQAVRLSLDTTIQTIAETQLRQTCQAFNAQSGQLIVMAPHTGQILAMANHPRFDPSRFTKSKPEDRRNRCVTDVFEPGSTFKPFIWAAATQMGLAKPDQVFDCTQAGVFVTKKGRPLRDVRGHGRITWDQVLIKSSNIGMATVGQDMPPQQMHAIVRAFGFGRVTGSGLPGEVAGMVTPLKKWNHYTLTSVPMGQEIAVTALQLTAGFGAIANGGYWVAPTILATPGTHHGQDTSIIYERVLEPAVAAHTRQVLRRVVTQGTGRRANSRLYTVFGKTGTAQIADRINGGYLEDQYIASFLGAAPLDAPRLVVACIIHRPDQSVGYHGGTVAAPAARRVIEQSLIYMGIHPDTPNQPTRTYAYAPPQPVPY